MCERRPTSAMPKPFLCCERAFCCSMVVTWPVLMHVMSFDVVVMSFDAMWLLVLCHVTWCNAMSCDVRSCDVPCNGHVVCSKWFCDDVVIQSTILYYKVLFCTTKYYSSTTLYYNVLLQYYSVLHSTTTYYSSTTLYCNVLLQYYFVTKYYSSTTLYCKVLLQYYSVLQSTTPVLLCTTKYYSSTTLYYTVLLQYYSVLQSSIHDWSLTHMNRYLHCAEQQEPSSNFTKYCTCHAKWLWWLIRVTYETSFTMRGATGVTIQLHQILRLPRKVTLMIDPRLTWNVIYNARSNKSHPPSAPKTAPATQSHSHDSSSSHMKRHLQCAEQHWFPSNITKYCACHEILSSRCQRKIPELLPPIERRFGHDPSMIRRQFRRQSEHKIVHLAPAASETLLFASWRRILYWKIQHFALRLSPKISGSAVPATKSDIPTSPNTAPATLMNLMIDPHHIWNVIYIAWSNKSQPPTAANSAPATQKCLSWLIFITYETSFTMRGATRVILQLHQILRLPRYSDLKSTGEKSLNCFRQCKDDSTMVRR